MKNINNYKYKYDLHIHTFPVSPCSDFSPEEVVDIYKKLGFNGIVITNHFQPRLVDKIGSSERFAEYFLEDYYKAKSHGDKNSIDVILGIEMRFPENNNDYLVYGVSEEDVYKASEYVYTDYETFYRGFKNDRNLIIQAHPFRDGCQLQNVELLDGIEVFNLHPNHNSRIGTAAMTAFNNPRLLITGGTDFHHDGQYGMCATCTSRKISDSFEIADIIRSQDFILDIWGNKVIPGTVNP